MRSIAIDAGVSPALVLHHFGSKDELRAAVEDHVIEFLGAVIDEFVDGAQGADAAAPFGRLADQPAVVGYVARSLIEGGPAGSSLFDRLFDMTEQSFAAMREAGALRSDIDDPEMAMLVVMAADFGVMLLRDHVTRRLGIDPLGAEGLDRWARAELDVLRKGVFVAAEPTDPEGSPGHGRH